jgi:predicted Fe-S protein YdhL (DUF1289 family)
MDKDKVLFNHSKKIKSPCTDKCKYNDEKVCVGCHRTKHEIVNWPDFSDEEKLKIIARVERKLYGGISR